MRMGAPRKEISELELLAFCEAPQTLKTLGEKFKLSASVIKRITDEMVDAELLIMHQSKGLVQQNILLLHGNER
jgi:hypothetical protein